MRVYKKRTNREAIPEDVIKTAISSVLKNRDKKGFSVRSVAKKHKLSYTTLARYVRKCLQATTAASDEADSDESPEELNLEWKRIPGQVISRDHETALIDYINRCNQINCALRPKHTRDMAYQYVIKYEISHPTSWDKNKKAGEDWLTSFLRRNKDRLPFSSEAMRSRAATANKIDVTKFYNSLKDLSDEHDLKENDIYSLIDTGVTTVVVPAKVAMQKIIKQETSVASPEKIGERLTLITATNAAGTVVPPMLIFPRKKYNLNFIKDGPSNCIGAANGTGLITNETFLSYVKHFVKHAKPTEKKPVLLILDSGNSVHLSINLLDLCRKEGVKLLALPPHCTRKLHPLDATMSGPFQNFCKFSIDEWLRDNCGKKMTIHDLPGIIKDPFARAMAGTNINLEFARTGIHPWKPEKFDDDEISPNFFSLDINHEQPMVQHQHVVTIPQQLQPHPQHPPQHHHHHQLQQQQPQPQQQTHHHHPQPQPQHPTSSMEIDYADFGYFM